MSTCSKQICSAAEKHGFKKLLRENLKLEKAFGHCENQGEVKSGSVWDTLGGVRSPEQLWFSLVQLPGCVSATCWWLSAMSTAAVTATAAPRTSASSPPAPCPWLRECRNHQKAQKILFHLLPAFVRALSSPSDRFLPLLSPLPPALCPQFSSTHSLFPPVPLCSSLWVFRW